MQRATVRVRVRRQSGCNHDHGNQDTIKLGYLGPKVDAVRVEQGKQGYVGEPVAARSSADVWLYATSESIYLC